MAPAELDEEQELAQQQKIFSDYSRFLNASTLATCVLAPVLIALPPRKVDLYTFSLTSAFVASLDYQAKARTGSGIMSRATKRFTSQEPMQAHSPGGNTFAPTIDSTRLLEEPVPGSRQGDGGSVLQRKAQEDWKQQRLKEEQEKLDQGEGYWSMIVDQVWQVWNQEEKKVEQLKEKDEEVVHQTKRVQVK